MDENFFQGYRRTTVKAEEILLNLTVPYTTQVMWFEWKIAISTWNCAHQSRMITSIYDKPCIICMMYLFSCAGRIFLWL